MSDQRAVLDPESKPMEARAPERRCRSCGAVLERVFVDLGMSPPCEDFLSSDRLHAPERFYPLDVRICDVCLLVQLPTYLEASEIFSEYAYFSSFSDSWVEHARRFIDGAIDRFGLTPDSRVVEVASNDGYLLRHVIDRGIGALGIEPAANVAQVGIDLGIPTVTEFFSEALARRLVEESGPADLLVANNVYAHVPDLNDFTRGLQVMLAPTGVLTIEVAHVVRLIEGNQFDTIYHEHFMYYSLLSIEAVLARHDLRVFDVEELPSHGGSLRVYVAHAGDARETTPRVEALRRREVEGGYGRVDGYRGFRARVEATKRDLLSFLIDAKRDGASIAGYGAPGKANTLLNYCGIGPDFIDYLVDRNPYKHGRYTPGTHIPIHPPERLTETRPTHILIMPWNLRDEISRQLEYTREWGAQLVVPIPRVEILPS
jgi:C-methyltransferase C-terminal domain/Putative zinc binding domain/Methyltransferase domain